MCSKAVLALLVYGIIMHCSVYCSPAAGLQYPALRCPRGRTGGRDVRFRCDRRVPRVSSLGPWAVPARSESRWGDRGARPRSAPSAGLRSRQGRGRGLRSEDGRAGGQAAEPGPVGGRAAVPRCAAPLSALCPPRRHADGIFNKAYRKLLGQLSARKYLHSLMAKRVGGASSGLGDEAEPLTKRHIDGIFTDSYSRYRKQMAVKKYLAAVLGKRYKQRVKNKGRRVAYL
ncbi:pituitary adenylate cyclase-activating polypeptide [Nothoprocta perdicaria]|uniref:pituitary adenylate cyclase-activating polypeptide n=1 Tax=Nothoprocta perdicaria TaxID=30464 RepID=UPI000E1C0C52|nr:pituitary adenylate cyclase-activating polypeptide [Nothoprocta perdicaria]